MGRDFHADNAYSLAASGETFWLAVYRKAFPTMTRCEICTDTTRQRQGIDRVLTLSNGRTVNVDEKKRAQEYGDILLEYVSALEYKTPGWIEKDLAIDYLAYAFMRSHRCYLFPWPMLHRAWVQYGQAWKDKYGKVTAKTKTGGSTYQTLSVPVPIAILRQAVSTAAVIDVTQEMRQ